MQFDGLLGVFWLNKAKVNCKLQQTANSLFSAWLSQKHKVRNCISYGDIKVCKLSVPAATTTGTRGTM
jgi:hypothetical protein